MPTIHPKDENPYFIDAESAAEMVRLTQQDRLLTLGMGGLLPEQVDLSYVQSILDIGCGPGGWVLDVAYAHPKIEVTGIDISKQVIDYAKAQAKVQWLNNAHFVTMDALKPLAFPDNSFDFINARYLFGFMSREAWPQLIAECKRILRPGGFLRLTECESPQSNSYAFERLEGMISQALYASGKSFSPDGRRVGMTLVISSFLRNAGFQHVQRAAHSLDVSAGTEAHASFAQDFKIGLRLLQPFLVKLGGTSDEEFEELYQQALLDMLLDDFCGDWYYLSVWGQKP
jgi:ubiquinone/menaquinone biosynthesis C-methylase UbiE